MNEYVLAGGDAAAIARIRTRFEPDARKTDETDGLSLDMGDWRFNLRASNTENVLRLNVESKGEMLETIVAEMGNLVSGPG